MLGLQLGDERRDLLHRLDERCNIGELGTDVHLHALDSQVRVLGGGLVGGAGDLQRDAELVVRLPRRDLGVRVRVDVGIDADRDRGLHAQTTGDVVDAGHLGLALDVECENAVLQRELDLLARLADAREDAPLHVRPGGEHAAQFAAAHEVERRAEVREVPQDRQRRVRLHRVADLEIETGQALRQTRVIVGHRRRAVDVGRRAVEPRDLGEIDGFAVQIVTRVAEVVHEKSGSRTK